MKVLQHLIINLNVELYTGLIYVFTNMYNDYLTPLIKMYQYYTTANDNVVGMKLLWYLSLTLNK